MKMKLLKWYSSSILKLLAFLGFVTIVNTGCMYGIEHVTFIEGKVTSKKTLQPIEGVEICLDPDHSWEQRCAETDEAGMYRIGAGRHFNLSFYDPSGNYERFDTLIEINSRRNTIEKTIDIQLSPRETNNDTLANNDTP